MENTDFKQINPYEGNNPEVELRSKKMIVWLVIFAVVILLCIGIYIIKRGGIYSSQRLEICKSKGKRLSKLVK